MKLIVSMQETRQKKLENWNNDWMIILPKNGGGSMKKYLEFLLSIPKTVYFNFKSLPLKQALKIPIFVHYNTKLINIHKNVVKLGCDSFGIVRYGFGGTYGIQPIGTEKNMIEFGNAGQICFNGRARFGKGTTIRVGGGIEFGNRFSSNRNCFFGCNDCVVFGDDVLLGWNVNIRDSDNHTIFWDGNRELSQKKVTVGNHVWICSCVDVLKGVTIPDDSVVAYQ